MGSTNTLPPPCAGRFSRHPSTWQRLLRQASPSVCVVSVLMVAHASAGDFREPLQWARFLNLTHAEVIVSMAETSEATLSESVEVPDFAPHVEMGFSVAKRPDSSLGKCAVLGAHHQCARWHYVAPIETRLIYRKIAPLPVGADLSAYEPADLTGRQVSNIPNADFGNAHAQRFDNSEGRNAVSLYSQIRSLKDTRGFVLTAATEPSDNPKTNGRYRQKKRENCDPQLEE